MRWTYPRYNGRHEILVEILYKLMMMCMLTNGCWKNQLNAVVVAIVPSFSLIILSLMAFAFVADYSYWLLFCYSSLHLHHNFVLFLQFLYNHHYFLFILTCFSFLSNSDSTRTKKNHAIENKWILNVTRDRKIVLIYSQKMLYTHAQRALRTHRLVSLTE